MKHYAFILRKAAAITLTAAMLVCSTHVPITAIAGIEDGNQTSSSATSSNADEREADTGSSGANSSGESSAGTKSSGVTSQASGSKVSARRASASNASASNASAREAEPVSLLSGSYWLLTTAGGTLTNSSNEEVTTLQGRTGYFTNSDGFALNIDASASGAKFAIDDNNNRTQVNNGTVISVPVTGTSAEIIITAHKYWDGGISDMESSEAQLNAEAALGLTGADSCSLTSIETASAADYRSYTYVCTYDEGTAELSMRLTSQRDDTTSMYIRSIETSCDESDTEEPIESGNEQAVMPFVADFGTPENLSVTANGQTLILDQTGGTMNTSAGAINSSVSYYLFPETAQWHTLTAEIVVQRCGSSNSNGVFFGAFDGTYLATAAIRNSTNLRGIYSKSSTELCGAGGPNAQLSANEKVTFQVKKTGSGLVISYTPENSADGSTTYNYNSSGILLFKDDPDGSKSCYYGFAFANVCVSIRNMILEDEDGTILYDQNDYYEPAGSAPVAASISAYADESREFIRVSWEGDDCEGDGYYVLQVSRDGSSYEDAALDLTGKTYDYPISEGGNYYFRVCGTLGSGGSESTRNDYVTLDEPIYVLAALPAPVVEVSASPSSISLSWNAIDTATHYEVYRYSYDETETGAVLLDTVAGTAYLDENITQQMPYYYYVKAILSSETEANSSNASAAVWAVPTGARYGEYVYEDEAVNVTITKKSYDTTYSDRIIIEGTVESACTLTAEVNGSIQQDPINLPVRDSFRLELIVEEGRNDVNLYFTDEDGNITRKTFNYVYLTAYDKVVDAGFTGADGEPVNDIPTYATVQAAVDSVSTSNTERVVILVKEGSYEEHLVVDRPYISLIGEDSEMTRIHFYDPTESPAGGDMATRCAVYIKEAAAGFTAENLTFANDYEYLGDGTVSNESADALRNDASGAVYVNVRILGYQDTLCANKNTQYYYKCSIMGNVDFIYGNEPRALFRDCELIFRYNANKNSGYLCAPKTAAEAEYGLTFYNCRLLSEESCSGSKYLLARPWGADAYINFIECYLGNVLNAEAPYGDMSGNLYTEARFYEFGSYGPGYLINEARRQISPSKAESLLGTSVLGWDPYDSCGDLGSVSYVGNIVTLDGPKYVTGDYTPDTYSWYDGDDTELGRFDMEGYAAAGKVSGGGLLLETSDHYYTAATAEELLQALTEVKLSGKKSVIEITADIGLGCNEVENFDSYNTVIKAYGAQPLTHPELIQTGTSVLMLKNMSNLTIFSRNGARILHANMDIYGSSNIIIRNLAFDELWEWDEETEGGYDRNDWDYMTIEAESTNIWIDHCTFYKAYDGVIDIKNPSTVRTSNITISWCQFLAGSKDGFFDVMMDHLASDPDSYPYYSHLKNDLDMTEEQIYMYSYGQKKTHLLGQSDTSTNAVNIRATFANNYYKDSMDRMPRLRYGDAHVYNCIMDAATLYEAKMSITNSNAAAKIVSNGASSTCDGRLLLENCYISGIVNALNSGNGSSPAGYINAINSVYYIEGEETALIPKSNSSTDDRVLILDAEAFKANLPYAEPVLYDAGQLDDTVIPNAGAGVLDLTVLQWEKTSYHDPEWNGNSENSGEDGEDENNSGDNENGRSEDGSSENGGSEDGSTENGGSGDGSNENGSSEDNSSQNSSDSNTKVSRGSKSTSSSSSERRQTNSILQAAVSKITTTNGTWASMQDGTWYLVKTNNVLAKQEWCMVNNIWYHFDSNGMMQTGWFMDANGLWYYLAPAHGGMLNGWQEIHNKWYYMDNVNGHCLMDTTTPDGYRVDKTGARVE